MMGFEFAFLYTAIAGPFSVGDQPSVPYNPSDRTADQPYFMAKFLMISSWASDRAEAWIWYRCYLVLDRLSGMGRLRLR